MLKKKRMCLQVSVKKIDRGLKRRFFSSRCSALMPLKLTLQWRQLRTGVWCRWPVARLFIISFHWLFFIPFPRASLEHRERRHIKDLYSCCELGPQKRTTKGYLHTHCKAFFFTLNTWHLKPLNSVQLRRKMPNCLSDTNFCWLGLFGLENKRFHFYDLHPWLF